MIIWPSKDPDEVLDFTWMPALVVGDDIDTNSVAVIVGTVAIDAIDATASQITLWLSGGVAGETAEVRLRCTTIGGRTFEDTAALNIVASNADPLQAFRMRFPEFATVPDGTIKYWLDDAATETTGFAAPDKAILLLAAHNLAMTGQGGGMAPGVTSFKSGTFSATVSETQANRTGLNATRYGIDYLALCKRAFAGPRLIRAGVAPECCA